MTTPKSAPAATPFDAADYLTSDERIAAYLAAAAEESDAALMARALGTVARARNMSQLARDTGLTRAGLAKALSGDGNPTLGTVMVVVKALGLRLGFAPVPKPAGGSPTKARTKARSRVPASRV